MMKITMKSNFDILDKGMARIEPMIDKSIGECAESIVNRVRYNWSASSPSNPGEPPAVVTGNLDSSIKADNAGRNALGQLTRSNEAIAWYIRIKAEYAAALEFGDSSKNLAPRPFLAPAVADEQFAIGDKIKLNFQGVWK